MRRLRSLLAALLLLVVLPGQTRAQTMVTPFVGAAFDKDTHDGARSVYGIAGGYWPAGPVGLEVEYAYHADFFPPHHPDGDHHVVGHLETLSVNLAVGAPFGGREGPGVRPYLTGGLVLFQIRADEPSSLFDVRGTDVGFNVGGGAIVFLGDHVGIRGDVRYLKNERGRVTAATCDCVHGTTVAFDRFSFTRATAGIVWRF